MGSYCPQKTVVDFLILALFAWVTWLLLSDGHPWLALLNLIGSYPIFRYEFPRTERWYFADKLVKRRRHIAGWIMVGILGSIIWCLGVSGHFLIRDVLLFLCWPIVAEGMKAAMS